MTILDVEAPAKQTFTERFRGKVVKSFTAHRIGDHTDPQKVREVLQKLDIIFDDGTKLTVSAQKVDITIMVRPIQGVRLGEEEPLEITAAMLVCE
jgi:hypothetical protein